VKGSAIVEDNSNWVVTNESGEEVGRFKKIEVQGWTASQ
jgi:hypothetical protein